jgi:porin
MTSPLYCQFVTNAICGQPTAPFFNMPDGLTAYPEATWAGLARFKTTAQTYVMLGIYDGDPGNGDGRHGANFGIGDNGVLLLSEIGYKPQEGFLDMPGRYSLGGFYHTGTFTNPNEGNLPNGQRASEFTGQYGIYVILEQMLHRNADRPETGLEGFLTFITSPDQDKSNVPYFMNSGLIYEGLIPGRPEDKTALGMYAAWFSSEVRGAQKAAGLSSQTSETGFELNHQIQLRPYLYLRPNIQYIVRPNGLASIANALVVGVEMGVTF